MKATNGDVMIPTVSLMAASTDCDHAGPAPITIAHAPVAAAKARAATARRTKPFAMCNTPLSRNEAPSSLIAAFRVGAFCPVVQAPHV
jgi:hypothetical protein